MCSCLEKVHTLEDLVGCSNRFDRANIKGRFLYRLNFDNMRLVKWTIYLTNKLQNTSNNTNIQSFGNESIFKIFRPSFDHTTTRIRFATVCGNRNSFLYQT